MRECERKKVGMPCSACYIATLIWRSTDKPGYILYNGPNCDHVIRNQYDGLLAVYTSIEDKKITVVKQHNQTFDLLIRIHDFHCHCNNVSAYIP